VLVVNATQLLTVDRSRLGVVLGSLSPVRVREIVAGLALVLACDRLSDE
jgi:mRNA-degrading endonuclease toxin of MazEF toxin-antitoxin module